MPDEDFAAYRTFYLNIWGTLAFSSDLSSLCCAKAQELGIEPFIRGVGVLMSFSPDVLRCSSFVS